MSTIETYRSILRQLPNWDDFLLRESHLPGPRANLELVRAAGDVGTLAQFERYLAWKPEQAPENTQRVFPVVCAVAGLGRLLTEGDLGWLDRLQGFANDPRWRVREAVCMALQRWGAVNMDALLDAMDGWTTGTPLEQRAALAALCEPDLLREERHARRVMEALERVTASLAQAKDRKSEAIRVLRKGLGYCWSVAVAALPEQGKPAFERWLAVNDPDVRWVFRENLKKNRLARLDPDWVRRCTDLMERGK